MTEPRSASETERARLGIRPDPRRNPGPERRTHGRHCPCTPCCLQDWSEPGLAPCGMHGSACPPVYDPYEDYPPPRLSVRPVLTHGDWRDMVLPRPYLYLDGDFTNAVINVGVNVGIDGGDALFSIGFDLVIPPRLFWLVNWLYRRDGRELVT